MVDYNFTVFSFKFWIRHRFSGSGHLDKPLGFGNSHLEFPVDALAVHRGWREAHTTGRKCAMAKTREIDLLVRKPWRFEYYWRINTKGICQKLTDCLCIDNLWLVPEFYFSCCKSANLLLEWSPLLLYLSVFPPLHTFFSLRGSKHSISHTKLRKAFTLSVQSTSAPSLGVDLFVTVPLVHCLAHGLLLGSATSQGHLSWNHAVLALSKSEEKGWCLYFWKPQFLSRKTLSNLETWEKIYLYREYKTKVFSNILIVFIALSNPPARKSAV